VFFDSATFSNFWFSCCIDKYAAADYINFLWKVGTYLLDYTVWHPEDGYLPIK
jgi:hypothetical protein